jgi:hypothetical protein
MLSCSLYTTQSSSEFARCCSETPARVTIFTLPLHVGRDTERQTRQRQLSVGSHIDQALAVLLAWLSFPPSPGCPRIAFQNVNVGPGLERINGTHEAMGNPREHGSVTCVIASTRFHAHDPHGFAAFARASKSPGGSWLSKSRPIRRQLSTAADSLPLIRSPAPGCPAVRPGKHRGSRKSACPAAAREGREGVWPATSQVQ